MEAYDYRGIKIQHARGALQLAEEQGERQKALDTARKMIADSLDPVIIAKYTGLSLEEIGSL